MSHRETKAGGKSARVLIVDDHPVVREGLGIRIGRQPALEVCGEASSIAEALAQLDATDPDVAIIDISLGEGDGLDLIRRIRHATAESVHSYGRCIPRHCTPSVPSMLEPWATLTSRRPLPGSSRRSVAYSRDACTSAGRWQT